MSDDETMTSNGAETVVSTQAAEQVWRPIASAPKDEDGGIGTIVLAYWEGDPGWTDVACWHGGHWTDPDDIEIEYVDPDYWMPLPSPPGN